jgi:ATP-dependent Clp protease ATP-binding subunit ClpA
MFERFTHAAREVVVHAHEEAAALGHAQVGSEHLLLAVATGGGLPAALGIDPDGLRAAVAATPGDGLDARALATIGIDLEAVRRSVEESFGPGALAGPRRGRPGRVRFGRSAKQALERALREALALRDRHIGTQHILLGLVGDPAGGAVQALRSCGSSAEAVRAAVLATRRAA